MNFVFISLQRINSNRESTSTNLARELARQHHNVLYVNPATNRKDLYFMHGHPDVIAHMQVVQGNVNSLQKISPYLWMLYPIQLLESINWIPYNNLFLKLLKINNRRFSEDIRMALEELGFEDFILINDKEMFRGFYLKELLKPSKYIYLDRDYTVGTAYWRRHGLRMEPLMMRKSDAVFCNSLEFTTRALQYNPNSFYIGNGFDATQFNASQVLPIPDDLLMIASPRIGYVGALTVMRLDLLILIKIAKARPSWSLVLIGAEDKEFAKSELHTLPNVFFLGNKHTQVVPAYLQHFDVCINPQIISDITRGNFPLKILEYLAFGKPIVATATDTMVALFNKYTYLAVSEIDYLIQIEKALTEQDSHLAKERISFVKKFSWVNIADLLIKHIKNL